jgi:hypothetical protein
VITTSSGATIFFTTDGTNPTIASVVYTGPIAVAQTTILRAMAVKPGFAASAGTAATYTITIPTGTTAPVWMTPGSGEYNNPVAVSLSSATPAATICYTIDGSDPTCAAGQCTGTAATYSVGSPVPVDAPTGGGTLVIKGLACSAGKADSSVTASTYAFRAAIPTATPGSGAVTSNTNVTLKTKTATSGPNAVSLRYNTSGLTPSCVLSDQTIQGQSGLVPPITKPTTLDVIACRQNYVPSAVASFAYSVLDGTVAPVCINAVPGGNPNSISPYDCTTTPVYWASGQDKAFVLNTATLGESIRYATADFGESIPDLDCEQACPGNAACTQCDSPAPDGNTCQTGLLSAAAFPTIRVIGCKANNAAGPLRQLQFADPTLNVVLDLISPPTGSYANSVAVTLTSVPAQPAPPAVPSATDAHICFTRGVATPPDPTCSNVTGQCGAGSTEYNGNSKPVIDTTGTTFKAIACRAGMPGASRIQTAVYTLE